MEVVAHLERMARELKCPICLSLLNSAVSLPCNHIFCNSCLEKSMRSSLVCPVCRVPYRRREIRSAPHMDNLVNVYKGMEMASGVNILDSQADEVKLTCNDKFGAEDNHETCTKSLVSEKSKLGGSRPESDYQITSRYSGKPSYPAKKRVQVPECAASLSEVLPEKRQDDATVAIEDKKLQRREFSFTPFFWLREEDSSERSSEQADKGTPMYTPPDVPCFSDIKDSDDEVSHKISPKGDSEMFHWTQRPCSPELCESPAAFQVEDSEENHCSPQLDTSTMNEASNPYLGISNRSRRRQQMKRLANTTSCLLRRESSSVAENWKSKRVKKYTDDEVALDSELEEANQQEIEAGLCLQEMQEKDGETEGVNQQGIEPGASLQGMQENITNDSSAVSGVAENRKNKRVNKCTSDDVALDSEPEGVNQLVMQVNIIKDSSAVRKNSRNVEKVGNECDADPLICPNNVGTGSGRCKMNGRRRRNVKMFKIPRKIGADLRIADSVLCHGAVEGGLASDSLDATIGVNKVTSSLKGPTLLRCAFCLSFEDSEASGVMVCYDKGKLLAKVRSEATFAVHVHKNCAEWAPNVYFEGDNAVNLERELSRSRRIRCSSCGLKGAALGCYERSCRKSFHLPCAKVTSGCRWDYENFVMLCPTHASSQLACEEQQHNGEEHARKRKSCVQQSVSCNGRKSRASSLSTKFKGLVLCYSALTTKEKATVSEFKSMSGVVVLKNWRSTVTHVIASRDETGACRRTFKFLMGILEAKWVLDVEWVRACMQAGDLVDERPYEVFSDIHGIQDGPRRGRLRLLNKQPRLFEGYKFFFMSDFAPSYKGFLHDLVTAAGGKVLSRKPVAGTDAVSTYVVYNTGAPEKGNQSNRRSNLSRDCAQAEALARSTGSLLVSSSWILDSIAGYALQEIGECHLLLAR